MLANYAQLVEGSRWALGIDAAGLARKGRRFESGRGLWQKTTRLRPLRAAAGIAAFDRLVSQAMRREPYASARRVFWIVDNGSAHRGQRAIDRLEGRPGTGGHRCRVVAHVHCASTSRRESRYGTLSRGCRRDRGER
jgi:hypothetical protein